MSFLGKQAIESAFKELFDPSDTYDSEQVQQSSYDLRLGEEVYIVGHKAPEKLSHRHPYVALTPGQFAVLTCYESLSLPREIMGFITLRNAFKMQGLVNVSGFHVDPTFRGRLVFAVQNVGPNDIRLEFMQPTFTIFFADVRGAGDSDRKERKHPREGIELQDVQRLGASSVSLAKLKKEMDTIKTMLLIYAPIAITLLVALIVTLIKLVK